jgi:DedD protein
MQDQDTEVTLGTGKLLGLFFAVVVVCALFFGLGFSLGRSAPPEMAAEATQPAAAEPPPVVVKGGAKPSAVPDEEKKEATEAPSSEDLSFFKSVESKEAEAKLESPKQEKPAETKPVARTTAPELAGGRGYVVQVAAVTKQEDAEALVSALRKKQYPVFMLGITPTDKFFRIQVGPFAELKEAETMKSRLSGDGYNPIVKR